MLKYKTSLKTKIMTICLFLLCVGMLTACGNKADKNGSMISDDGRSYGGLITGDVGETIETAFFDLTVNEVSRYDMYQFDDGLYEAEDGNTYLLVNVTVKNTYDEDIPISITDFTLSFDGNKSKNVITGHGKADLKPDSFMDNIFTLKKGEEIKKSILFTVKDKKSYTLNYSEYYEDEFKGDKFSITMNPSKVSVDEDGDSSEKEAEKEKGESSEDSREPDDGSVEE